jgi:hypothetical protein
MDGPAAIMAGIPGFAGAGQRFPTHPNQYSPPLLPRSGGEGSGVGVYRQEPLLR